MQCSSTPGLGRSLGEGNDYPLQCSCLENPWTEEPGGLQSKGSQRVGQDWATDTSLLFSGSNIPSLLFPSNPRQQWFLFRFGFPRWALYHPWRNGDRTFSYQYKNQPKYFIQSNCSLSQCRNSLPMRAQRTRCSAVVFSTSSLLIVIKIVKWFLSIGTQKQKQPL